mmetsp:Transcript_96026/g.190336  ORF Transcript_96026/g.190336 Transcript_96026/m.190336 type:complete len:127 (-) Transcript_96026:282-662(-)
MALFRRAGASLTSIFSSEGSFFNSELLVDDDYAFSRAFSDFDDLPVVTRQYTPEDMNASNREAYQKCITRMTSPPGNQVFEGTREENAACRVGQITDHCRQLAEGRAAATARYVHSYDRWTRVGSK